MSGYPVLSTRFPNFASRYLCSSPPPLSSASSTRVAKLSMPGRLFRRPSPPQLSETSWQLASKGRLVILRNAFENLCRTDTSRRTFSNLRRQARPTRVFPRNRFASNKFSRFSSEFTISFPISLFLSFVTRINRSCYANACQMTSETMKFRFSRIANFLIALSRGLVSYSPVPA